MSETILRQSLELGSTSLALLEDYMLMEYESIKLTQNINLDFSLYSVLKNEYIAYFLK